MSTRIRGLIGIAADVALLVAGVLVVAIVLRNQPTRNQANHVNDDLTLAGEHLADVDQVAIRHGSSHARLEIVEFMDLQCPICKTWASQLDELIHEFGEHLQIRFVHFPLARHRYATAAAIAVECAEREGKGWSVSRIIMANQDDIATAAWVAWAEAGGVVNLSAFRSCVSMPVDSFPRIVGGVDLGRRAGITGTPTIWFNGKRQRPTPEIVRRILSDAGI